MSGAEPVVHSLCLGDTCNSAHATLLTSCCSHKLALWPFALLVMLYIAVYVASFRSLQYDGQAKWAEQRVRRCTKGCKRRGKRCFRWCLVRVVGKYCKCCIKPCVKCCKCCHRKRRTQPDADGEPGVESTSVTTGVSWADGLVSATSPHAKGPTRRERNRIKARRRSQAVPGAVRGAMRLSSSRRLRAAEGVEEDIDAAARAAAEMMGGAGRGTAGGRPMERPQMVSFKLGSLAELEAEDDDDNAGGFGLTPAPGGQVAQSDGGEAGDDGSGLATAGAPAVGDDGYNDVYASGSDSGDSLFEVDAEAGVHNAALEYMTPRGRLGEEPRVLPPGESFMQAGGPRTAAPQLDDLDK